LKKHWTIQEVRRNLYRDPRWLNHAVLAIYRRHLAQGQPGFDETDAATGLYVGRLLARGFSLTDFPAHQRWAERVMQRYVLLLARIANGEA
jgi:hypothetical protein